MDQLAKDRASTSDRLRTLYAPIREELAEAEEVLRGHLRSEHAFVDRLAQHGFRLGGKRLRPALVLLSGKAAGELQPMHPVLAAAVEMIHTATLIHDDVLDEATIRRHLDTVNARWNNETSILLGDFLFAQAICMVNALDDPYASRVIGEAAKAVCEGELRQVGTRGNYELTEAEYFDIIAHKTAALTAVCCQVGAHYAGASDSTVEALATFGRELGIAFQIADDLLDVLGDEATAGKSLGTDLIKQKPTLPVIYLLSQLEDNARAEVLAILDNQTNHHREALQPWFSRFGAIEYAREKAIEHTQAAVQQLDGLPNSQLRESLTGLTDFVINRNK